MNLRVLLYGFAALAISFACVGCYTDEFVNHEAATNVKATASDFVGPWATANYVSARDSAFVWVYKLESDGTGTIAYRAVEKGRKFGSNYNMTWKQTAPGEIFVQAKKLWGDPFQTAGDFTSKGRLANNGLEVTWPGCYLQFYKPGSPQMQAMIENQHDKQEIGRDNPLADLTGAIARGYVSGATNAISNNPNASAGAIRSETASGVLKSLQQQ